MVKIKNIIVLQMFEIVEVLDLYPDHKYKIIANEVYTGIYKGECWHNKKTLIFDNVCGGCPRYFLKSCKFYKFVSKKDRIQSDMEKRAFHIIMRQLLGDDFEW